MCYACSDLRAFGYTVQASDKRRERLQLLVFSSQKGKQHKPVPNANMISFTRWTTVEEVVEIPPAFPLYTYSLTPLEQIRQCVDKNEYFLGTLLYSQIYYTPRWYAVAIHIKCFYSNIPDVIGVVASVSSV